MAKPLKKERDNRSADKKDLSFHPYTIDPESAHTAILLLESAEPEILCQTLRAVTKFAAQDTQNRYVLYNLNTIRYVLPHVEHNALNVRRFALKALAQLCQLPRGPEQVLENPENLKKIANILVKIEDVFVLEFASLVLAELTREPLGCEQLVAANILDKLFARFKNSLDPDVQKNCLQTLSNLLDDPACASLVTKNQHFSWPSLLLLMQSKYLAIQHTAMRTVDQLICRYKDLIVQKTFRASTGVLDLLDILETYEFRDVHSNVLSMLRHYVSTEENAAHAQGAGCILRLLAYLETAPPSTKTSCLAVLTHMSSTVNGREALHQMGTELVFCQQLAGTGIALWADAALGVANMTRLLAAAVRMCDTNVVEALCSILSDDFAAWFYVRMNALRALVALCRVIPKAAVSLIEPKTFSALRNININYKDSPIEAQRLAVQCYKNLLNYHEPTSAMLNAEFIQELLNILSRLEISLKIMSCEVLCGLMASDGARELFTSRCGEAVVSGSLRVTHVALRTALCSLISNSVTAAGADVYLHLGTIDYMLGDKAARYSVGAWEPAIEAILNWHPSAKLAYTGRLEINNFTQDGFYVQKRLTPRLPSLDELIQGKDKPREPVLLCDFRTPPPRASQNADGSEIRPLIPEDTGLRSYLVELKLWLNELNLSSSSISVPTCLLPTPCAVAASLKARAQLLAQFVAQQMCGLDRDHDCSPPTVDLHLSDLMVELESPVIGLGLVRVGGPLERALLYKALADRVALPCALRRAGSARAWCELAIPHAEPAMVSNEENTEDTLVKNSNEDVTYQNRTSQTYDSQHAQGAAVEEDVREERYPVGLLRANYVVDLMARPGALYPLGGHEASAITGPGRDVPYTARAQLEFTQTSLAG